MSFAPRKQEKDYTQEVKAIQPDVEKLANVSGIPENDADARMESFKKRSTRCLPSRSRLVM
jgi:hypothetical protein